MHRNGDAHDKQESRQSSDPPSTPDWHSGKKKSFFPKSLSNVQNELVGNGAGGMQHLEPPKADFGFSEEEDDGTSTIEDAEIQFSKKDLLGEGNFGAVYRGVCRGAQVAVKVPKLVDVSQEGLEAFRDELQVNAKIVHPRVVALLGAYIPRDYRKGELKIVMELFGKDDIEKLLLDPKRNNFTLYERVKWMKQVAEGMAWIHGAGIVHRDLKPSNVLYDSRSRSVKVCDFGLSVLLPKGNSTLLDPKGTPLYVAPELVTEGPTTHACDVFSFGIMGYVFIARQRPYDNQAELPDDIAEFLGYVVEGTRPWMSRTQYDFPSVTKCPLSLRDLLTWCWDGDFTARPTFEEILRVFDGVLVDCAMPTSVPASTFWKRKYVNRDGMREDVPFTEFRGDLLKAFSSTDDNALGAQHKDIVGKCLKELFCETKQKEDVVNIETFGRVLGFLPPLRKGFFMAIVDLCRQPWFWGGTEAKAAYKALVPARSRSFMVRFSSAPPNVTVSFKEKGGNILHRRILRQVDESTCVFENGDMCSRATQPFKSLPHLVEEMKSIMHWKDLPGGPFSWIFNEPGQDGGYGGYTGGYNGYSSGVTYDEDDDVDEESDSGEGPAEAKPVPVKLLEKDLKVLTKIRFLNRSAVVTEVRGEKIQVIFSDLGRKEWVKKASLLERAFLE